MMNTKKTILCVFLVSCLFLIFPEQGEAAPSYDISVTAGQGGKITPKASSINEGASKSYSVKPNKGFHVAEIRVDGATILEDRKGPSTPNDGMSPPLPTDINLQRSGTSKVYKYTFHDVQQNHSLEAVFETDTFALHVSKTGLGTGIVESAPAGISCGDTCVGIFPYNSNVTFMATGDGGSVFDGWTGKCKKGVGGSCTMNIKKESSLTAAFAREFKLSMAIAGNGVVSSSPKGFVCGETCSQQVKENNVVKLKGKASTDSAFFSWTGCTTLSGSTCSVSMNEDRYVEVAFVAKDVPHYNLDTNNLPQSMILQVPSKIPQRNGAYAHCYLEAYAVQMAYLDPSITMEEVFAFAGLGSALSYSSYVKGLLHFPLNNWTWPLHARAMRNYGVNFVIGHSPDISREYLKGAFGEVTHATGEEALQNLKAVIRSGRPVEVHIDLAYMPGLSFPPGSSHFILITGYDADSVYWTDPEPDYVDFPVDPSEYVNVKIPIADFMLAWQEAGKIGKGAFIYCAPHFMLFLHETDVSQINRIAVDDILLLQKSISQNNASVIESSLSRNLFGTPWDRIAMTRHLFADYLRGYGYTEAAAQYEFLAEEYNECRWISENEQKARLNNVIKPMELQVRTLF